MAVHFLMGADQEVYGSLVQNLKNLYLVNNKNKYPKSLTTAYVPLKGWAMGKKGINSNQLLGMAFNVNSKEQCNHKNHPTSKCFTKKKEDGTVLHNKGSISVEELNEQVSENVMFGMIGNDVHELMFLNTSDDPRPPNTSFNKPIPDTSILLNSQSTINVFSNADILSNIHPIKTTMYIKCNAGTKSTNLWFFSGYGWVWSYPAGIANILSLSHVKESFSVTYDSAGDNAFHVHKEDRVLKFQEAARCFYYLDIAAKNCESTMLITTVDNNISKYSITCQNILLMIYHEHV
ncbi:hypothetical protein ACHAW6_008296 [Cyclotella cf. meneghiniana]